MNSRVEIRKSTREAPGDLQSTVGSIVIAFKRLLQKLENGVKLMLSTSKSETLPKLKVVI